MTAKKSNAAHLREVERRLAKYPPGALRSWMAAHLSTPGHRISDALRELNEAQSVHYRSNRLYEWLTGEVSAPEPVREHARREALAHVLEQHGCRAYHLTDEQIAGIVEALR